MNGGISRARAASAIEQADAPPGSDPAVDAEEAERQRVERERQAQEARGALRRRNEEQRLQAVAEACPGKSVTGPVPASLARDLCQFITEAAATERGAVLIIMVTRPMADAITLRSLAIEEALTGMGTRWTATSRRALRLEVYYGRVHLATVRRSLGSGAHQVRWRR
ncbi:MAG: hypothetical protein OXR82_10905 [Gammaproteobacteria bacterium]|nr:hypothetical protein [Gammaproteobacteria bacterium]MDE0258874.1 hypothetical protein [Gammaproteobacteria bacterium]